MRNVRSARAAWNAAAAKLRRKRGSTKCRDREAIREKTDIARQIWSHRKVFDDQPQPVVLN